MEKAFADVSAFQLSEASDLLDYLEVKRIEASRNQKAERKAELGQFFTPASIARMMASMLEYQSSTIHILDAGAGIGSLFAAATVHFCTREARPEHISVLAYEVDESLTAYLYETMRLCQQVCQQAGITFTGRVEQRDFIQSSVDMLANSLFSSPTDHPQFHCAILNPPYRKIQTQSLERRLLRQIGIQSSNLYAGFLEIATQLLLPGGELVAITPRSFCNGPYFQHFRENFLKMMSLRRLHVFNSRTQTFSDDSVLQENIILHAVKSGEKPERVTITSSTGMQDELILVNDVPYRQVVHLDDPHLFIHIVQDQLSHQVVEKMAQFRASLNDLGFSVSTGRVVDFRAIEFLRLTPEVSTVPLLFPTHVNYGSVTWPKADTRKPNALANNPQTQSLLVPNEHYVLVKRFSSKEEKRRIVAAVYDPEQISGTMVAFENHLNYFHRNGKGLSPLTARGLAAFLNSTLVDEYFRQFNGHTQVNATDLRNMKYPTLRQLEALGARITETFPTQRELDEIIQEELLGMSTTDNIAQEQDPIRLKQRIEEALSILKDVGLPRAQQNERSALTLLALLHLTPTTPWAEAGSPLCGITPMMEFFRDHYGKDYKPDTRETVRRQTVHQFLEAGLIVANPDQPERPINSPNVVYQIEQSTLELLRTYGTSEWDQSLRTYLASVETLQRR